MRSIHAAIVIVLATASAAASAPVAAHGHGWQGVVPGLTTETEVTAKFGQPSTQGKLSGRAALVYKGDQAIVGTRQAQFFLRDDGLVTEVVVFPTTQLDKEAVEGTYGHPSQKAFTDDFRSVWFFKASGITVFFGKDAFVDAISFKAPEGNTVKLEPSHPPQAAEPSRAAPANAAQPARPQGKPSP